MKHAFAPALGDPRAFISDFPKLAEEFGKQINVEHYQIKDIRAAVEARDFQITDDPNFFRRLVAAFCVILIDWYAQRIRIRGVFTKRISVESKGFRWELLDLFYRCIYEGVDFAPEGEALPAK